MILILSDTPILKYSDSNFDADDWASVGVQRASLLLRFLPPSPSLRLTCRSSRKRWAVGRSEHRLGHPSESERVLAGCHSHSAARSAPRVTADRTQGSRDACLKAFLLKASASSHRDLPVRRTLFGFA